MVFIFSYQNQTSLGVIAPRHQIQINHWVKLLGKLSGISSIRCMCLLASAKAPAIGRTRPHRIATLTHHHAHRLFHHPAFAQFFHHIAHLPLHF